MRSSFALLSAALFVAGVSWICPAHATESPAVPDRISVVGQGTVETLPDAVEVDFRVRSVAESVENAKAVVDKAVSEVLAACIDLGIDRNSITATDLAVAPNYSYDLPTTTPKLQGYEVSRGITIRLAKVASFNEVVRLAIHSGVNEITRIEMKSSKDGELREQALLNAMRDGKKQAETIAREAGRQIDRVTSVATEDARVWDGYSPGGRFITVNAEKLPEFQPGPIRISTRVFISLSMK